MISLLFFGLAVIVYTCSQLQIHGKLRWSKGYYGFWDGDSYLRKYKKNWNRDPIGYDVYDAPNNLYYKYIARVKYRERWFTSTNLTIFLTDGYHLMQSLFFISLAFGIHLEITIFEGWVNFLVIWSGLIAVHAVTYRLLQK